MTAGSIRNLRRFCVSGKAEAASAGAPSAGFHADGADLLTPSTLPPEPRLLLRKQALKLRIVRQTSSSLPPVFFQECVGLHLIDDRLDHLVSLPLRASAINRRISCCLWKTVLPQIDVSPTDFSILHHNHMLIKTCQENPANLALSLSLAPIFRPTCEKIFPRANRVSIEMSARGRRRERSYKFHSAGKEQRRCKMRTSVSVQDPALYEGKKILGGCCSEAAQEAEEDYRGSAFQRRWLSSIRTGLVFARLPLDNQESGRTAARVKYADEAVAPSLRTRSTASTRSVCSRFQIIRMNGAT